MDNGRRARHVCASSSEPARGQRHVFAPPRLRSGEPAARAVGRRVRADAAPCRGVNAPALTRKQAPWRSGRRPAPRHEQVAPAAQSSPLRSRGLRRCQKKSSRRESGPQTLESARSYPRAQLLRPDLRVPRSPDRHRREGQRSRHAHRRAARGGALRARLLQLLLEGPWYADDISLVVPAGTRTAIVGEAGGGRWTG
jgi:hypothetical protein